MTLSGVSPALADAKPGSFWLDNPARPGLRAPLTRSISTDLVVVGGGYTGLWTALMAKQRDPGRDVVLLEAGRVGWAASGRNGGFCSASLTHGEANGRQRWPDDYDELYRLGMANLDGIEQTVQRYGIDCDFRRTGELDVATEPYQVDSGIPTVNFWTGMRYAPNSTRRLTWPAHGTEPAVRSSIRPGWHGDWPQPQNNWACA